MANAPQYRNTMQEMYIKVFNSGYSMPNVYENFTMVIQQNGRKDNIITKHQQRYLQTSICIIIWLTIFYLMVVMNLEM